MADLSSDSEWRREPAAAPAAGVDALEHAQGWDRLVVVFGLWLSVVLAYWPSALALNGFWTDTVDKTYTHGYVVLFISIWLVVRKRKLLRAAPLAPQPSALWILAVFGLAWVYFYGAAIQDPQLLLLPLILFAAVVATLGWPSARVLYFPIGFLFFAMPAWSDIGGLLQSMSISANDFLLWAWGIPAYVTGKYVHLPAGVIEIAEGCGGLHFFMVGLALAALYGELAHDSRRRRMVWLGLMGVIAVLANWLRIFVVIAAGYETNMKTYLITVSHYWFGWGLFVVFFFGFLWLAGVLTNRWDRRARTHVRAADRTASSVAAEPAVPGRIRIKPLLAALATLGVLPGAVYGMNAVRPIARPNVAIEWPAAPSGWQGPQAVGHSAWKPDYRNATAQSFQRYVSADGHGIEIFAVAYRRQTQAGKLLWWWNSLLGRGHLRAVSARLVNGASGPWRQEMLVNAAGARSLIWVRYAIGARYFVHPRLSQLWYGIAAFTSRPVSSLTALRAGCRPGCAAARARLSVAAARLVPTVHAEIGK